VRAGLDVAAEGGCAGLYSWTKPQASDTHRVREISGGNGTLASALQFADGEYAGAAGDAQPILGYA
jgi:hypothetical protein